MKTKYGYVGLTYDKDEFVVEAIENSNITLCNGITFNPDGSMYYDKDILTEKEAVQKMINEKIKSIDNQIMNLLKLKNKYKKAYNRYIEFRKEND